MFRFVMGEFGWGEWILAFDDFGITIQLSALADPFKRIADWALRIQEGLRPAYLDLDEEGSFVSLLGIPLARREGYVSLTIASGERDIYERFELNCMEMLDALRKELNRFFETEFVAEQWHSFGSGTDTRAVVLGHPFLKTK